MKKIMIFLMTIFTAMLFMPRANAQAITGEYEFYDHIENFKMAQMCDPGVKMNVLKGLSTQEEATSNNLYQELIYANETFDSGVIVVDGIFDYGSEEFTIKMRATFDKQTLIEVTYSFKDEVFYRLTSDAECFATVTLSKELHMPDLMGFYSKDCSFREGHMYYEGFSPDLELEEFLISLDYENIGMELLYGTTMTFNTVYNGKDVHLVTEHLNPRPLPELLGGIKITDKSDGKITTYQIIKSNYDNKNCKKGVYEARIAAVDKAGNAVVQDLKINVVDAVGPVITLYDRNISYAEPLNYESILSSCLVKDDSGKCKIELDCEEYLANNTKIGTYPYTVTATDPDGNVSVLSKDIHVIDDIIPVIRREHIKVDAPYNKLTEDEIKDYITVVDEIDGTFAKEDIILTDLAHYQDNYNKLGKYNYKIEATDKAGNKAISYITIAVVDENYPEIEFESGVITVSSGEKLTKESIMNILRQTGQLKDEVIVDLKSAYFDEKKPEGSYELEIILSDGRILKDTINVVPKPDLDFEAPKEKDDKPDKNIKLIAIATLFGAASLMGAVIFIKRKH